MKNKVLQFALSVLSAAGTIYVFIEKPLLPALTDFIKESNLFCISKENADLLSRVVILGIFFALIWFPLKKYADIYMLLYAMAKNNKLHTLRELVMVKSERAKKLRNELCINSAVFSYDIKQSWIEESHLGIRYSLDFSMSRKRFTKATKKNRTFNFYIIVEGTCNLTNHITHVTLNGVDQKTTAIINPVTIHGTSYDKQREFSGLYDVQMNLPETLSKQDKVDVHFSYDVANNLHKGTGLYVFAILPQNYGRKMCQMEINLFTMGKIIYNPAIQEIDTHGNYRLVASLAPDRTETDVYQYRRVLRPEISSAYFVQFDLSEYDY